MRTSTPASASTFLARWVECSVKWKMFAAETAEAPAATPSTSARSEPTPPQAITGIVVAPTDGRDQREVVPLGDAVLVDRVEEDLAGPPPLGLADPLDHVEPGRLLAPARAYLPLAGARRLASIETTIA